MSRCSHAPSFLGDLSQPDAATSVLSIATPSEAAIKPAHLARSSRSSVGVSAGPDVLFRACYVQQWVQRQHPTAAALEAQPSVRRRPSRAVGSRADSVAALDMGDLSGQPAPPVGGTAAAFFPSAAPSAALAWHYGESGGSLCSEEDADAYRAALPWHQADYDAHSGRASSHHLGPSHSMLPIDEQAPTSLSYQPSTTCRSSGLLQRDHDHRHRAASSVGDSMRPMRPTGSRPHRSSHPSGTAPRRSTRGNSRTPSSGIHVHIHLDPPAPCAAAASPEAATPATPVRPPPPTVAPVAAAALRQPPPSPSQLPQPTPPPPPAAMPHMASHAHAALFSFRLQPNETAAAAEQRFTAMAGAAGVAVERRGEAFHAGVLASSAGTGWQALFQCSILTARCLGRPTPLSVSDVTQCLQQVQIVASLHPDTSQPV